jgi:hypothetical protein
MARRKQV